VPQVEITRADARVNAACRHGPERADARVNAARRQNPKSADAREWVVHGVPSGMGDVCGGLEWGVWFGRMCLTAVFRIALVADALALQAPPPQVAGLLAWGAAAELAGAKKENARLTELVEEREQEVVEWVGKQREWEAEREELLQEKNTLEAERDGFEEKAEAAAVVKVRASEEARRVGKEQADKAFQRLQAAFVQFKTDTAERQSKLQQELLKAEAELRVAGNGGAAGGSGTDRKLLEVAREVVKTAAGEHRGKVDQILAKAGAWEGKARSPADLAEVVSLIGDYYVAVVKELEKADVGDLGQLPEEVMRSAHAKGVLKIVAEVVAPAPNGQMPGWSLQARHWPQFLEVLQPKHNAP